MTETEKPKRTRRSEMERVAAELESLSAKIKAAEQSVADLKAKRDTLKAEQKAKLAAAQTALDKA